MTFLTVISTILITSWIYSRIIQRLEADREYLGELAVNQKMEIAMLEGRIENMKTKSIGPFSIHN